MTSTLCLGRKGFAGSDMYVKHSSGAIKTACDIQIEGKSVSCDKDKWRSSVRSAMRAASQLPGGEPTDVDDAPTCTHAH